VDTNILVYSDNKNSIFHERAKKFLEENLSNGKLVVSLQNLLEYYSVITNPKTQGSLAGDLKSARKRLDEWLKLFKVVIPLNEVSFKIVSLLEACPLKGAEIYDLYLATTMMAHKIDTIYTVDTKIFKKLGLAAINPLT
jgi:predicted nucleic acid-binding protein